MSGAVHQQVARVDDAQPPALGAVARDVGAAGAEVGVVQGRIDGERHEGVGRGLVVGRLGLELGAEDVAGAHELVVVQDVVLDGGADEPDGAGLGLDEQPAARVDGDLRVGRVLDVVVRHPQPRVLHVQAGGAAGDVHAHVGSDAGRHHR